MEFELIDVLKETSLLQFILLAAAVAALALFAVLSKKPQKRDTRALFYGAMCISLAFVLSYLRILRMPQGGSITMASMLPIMAYSYWYGCRNGLIAGLAYGVLQFIQDPQFYHPVQVFLDYGAAFLALALTGLFRKRLLVGMGVAGVTRMLCHIVSGAVFFAQYAPEGQNPWIYSLGYTGMSIGPDLLICLIAAAVPQMRAVIESVKRRVEQQQPGGQYDAAQANSG